MKTRGLFLLMVASVALLFSACEPKDNEKPAPVADFSVSKTQINANETVQYNSTVSNGPVAYKWQFSGGTPSSSTDANPSVVYTTAGQYGATLVVTRNDDAQSATVKKDNVVTVATPAPVADFKADKVAVGIGDKVTLTDLTANGPVTAYLWTFEGGTPATSTIASPSVTYTNVGKYKITLKVTTANGENTVSKADYITVSDNRIKISGKITNVGNQTLTKIRIDNSVDSDLGETTNFGADHSYEILVPRSFLGKTVALHADIDWISVSNPNSTGVGIIGSTIVLAETNTVDWRIPNGN